MSEEQLDAFLAAVKIDAGLQKKLRAAGNADAVAAIATAAGFAITADELKKAQSELSDAELEELAGGKAGDTRVCKTKVKNFEHGSCF